MDLFVFTYYGVICSGLAISAPMLDKALHRLLFGLTTGILAAIALPFARGWMS